VKRLFCQFALHGRRGYASPAEFGPREFRYGNNVKKDCTHVWFGLFKERACDTQHVLCVRRQICIDSYHYAPVHRRFTCV
jgi:hypothetical protein